MSGTQSTHSICLRSSATQTLIDNCFIERRFTQSHHQTNEQNFLVVKRINSYRVLKLVQNLVWSVRVQDLGKNWTQAQYFLVYTCMKTELFTWHEHFIEKFAKKQNLHRSFRSGFNPFLDLWEVQNFVHMAFQGCAGSVDISSFLSRGHTTEEFSYNYICPSDLETHKNIIIFCITESPNKTHLA